MGWLEPNNKNGVRSAYQMWEPEHSYYPERSRYHTRISWNQFQSAKAKLTRKPRLGRLETFFPSSQLTFHTLGNGVGGYNDTHRFIVVQANSKRKANLCAVELGLPSV